MHWATISLLFSTQENLCKVLCRTLFFVAEKRTFQFRLRAGLPKMSGYWSACHMVNSEWLRGWKEIAGCRCVKFTAVMSRERRLATTLFPLWHPDAYCPLSRMVQVTVNAGCRSKTVSKGRNLQRTMSKPWRKSLSNHLHAWSISVNFVTISKISSMLVKKLYNT